jgi:hypothetical protein
VSAYDKDDRVYRKETGTYWVELPGDADRDGSQDGYVTPLANGRFLAYVGESSTAGCEFDTADEAIRSLLGAPQ